MQAALFYQRMWEVMHTTQGKHTLTNQIISICTIPVAEILITVLVEDVATINWLGLLTLLAFPRTDPASRHTVNASKTSSFQVPSSTPSQTWGIFFVSPVFPSQPILYSPPLYCDSLQSKVTASSFQWSGNAMSWYLGIIWIFHAIRTYNQCQQNISSLNAERKDLWCLSYSWLSYLFPVHCKNLPSLLTSAK